MQIIVFNKWQKNINFKVVARQFEASNNLLKITTREGNILISANKVGEFTVKTRHRELTRKKIKKYHIWA